jgi:chemotaxis methyl-accepting protein methylase
MRVKTIQDVCDAIRRRPESLKIAISALLIGVSSFFRDGSVFAAIDQTVIPQLLTDTLKPRIWSVGCSDGAELYSIAMLLADRGALQRCELLGTDCRSDAIGRAREGAYSQEGIKDIPRQALGRYLQFDGRAWTVDQGIRNAVTWQTQNVLDMENAGKWDLILCRNMAIYLHSPTAGRLWAMLERSLRPGGRLVLGKAERPHGAKSLRPIAPCIYQRDWS